MKRGFLISAAAAALVTTAAGLMPVFAATNSPTYTVQSGDTLYKIAQSHRIALSALEQANPQISNVAYLYPGEVLNLPAPAISTYIVSSGDTFYKIAAAHGVSLSTLESANPQITNFTNIYPGQSINIPLTSSPVTSSPATTSASSGNNASSGSTPAASMPTASTPSASSTNGATSTNGAPSTSNERQDIVNYAKTLIGIPYVWGGQSPSVGFDCSGFTEYVFAHFGITLPRESHDQATVGTPVSQSALQPGDMLFFKDTDSSASLYANQVTHVGIYIGNGAMIESSSVNNKGVTIVQNVFTNPYYLAHYYGARDVLN